MTNEDLELLKQLFGYEPKPIKTKRKIKPFREWNGQTQNAGIIEPWDGKYEGEQIGKVPWEMLWHRDTERYTKF
jgi:hypothetical protein